MATGVKSTLTIYAENAEHLIPRYDAVETDAILAPFTAYLPQTASRIIDIGAGTGRDAAWFAARGHSVTAVEPTAGLRAAGQARHGARIEWVADVLPDLITLKGRAFDFVLVNAVWHHLDGTSRLAAITRLAEITCPGGRALISLRLGSASPDHPIETLEPVAEIENARRAGFRLLDHIKTGSQQKHNRLAGVTWSWIALEREGAA
ncbi:class I SAM-dependent methyltransferase [Arenibacterium sp. CAU 1754]